MPFRIRIQIGSVKEKTLKVTKIVKEECLKTRQLWEEVFSEDSRKFVDYYYNRKAKDNIGYVSGEEPFQAMMFRTPYKMKVYREEKSISYIVGVATKKEFRHKGHMTALLLKSFQDMYLERNPFTFLMPANPAIYEPFDFSYVYERDLWSLEKEWISALEELWAGKEKEWELQAAEEKKDRKELIEEFQNKKNCRLLSIRNLVEDGEEEILQEIADFSKEWLEERYEIYTVRDVAYYERQLQELLAQNGDIFVAKRKGQILGFFLYAREGNDLSIQEVLEKEEGLFSFLMKEKTKKPIIMARIIHLEEMFRLLRSKERKNLLIDVEDPFLTQNEGIYRLEITPMGTIVSRLKDPRPVEETIHIRELTKLVLKNMFVNEIV